MGKDWDKALPPKEAFVEICRVLKPGALAFVMSSPRQDLMWRMAQLLEESGFELGQSFISWVYASGFPKAYDVGKGIDKKLGIERNEFKKVNPFPDGGKRKKFGIRNNNIYEHGDSGKLSELEEGLLSVSQPASPEAKRWSGWKSVGGLKPALEVIFMVQKPLSEKTIVDNVLKWGTGAMNADTCRLPLVNDENLSVERFGEEKLDTREQGWGFKAVSRGNEGRFPANLLVSDDALNDGKITKSVIAKDREGKQPQGVTYMTDKSTGQQHADEGSFCRFFNLDAWAKHHGFLNVPKASTGERDRGLYGFEEKESGVLKGSLDGSLVGERGNGVEGKSPVRMNLHPTVKPVELMAYLIELGCPSDGVVLDPFLGSGTTCVAARMLGRNYIGIEISEEYHRIAVARVASTPRLTTLDRY